MRRIVVVAALLMMGCSGEAGFEPLLDTTLPTPDCFDTDSLQPTVAPLRATLRRDTGGLARNEVVTIRTNEPDFVWVLERSAFDAVAPPEGFWDSFGPTGQVWAELTGGVGAAAPRLSLTTDNAGGLQGLVWIDIPGICNANIPFSDAIVTLEALESTSEMTIRYGELP